MKTTWGWVRQALNEAADDKQITEHDGFHVGQYYAGTDHRGQTYVGKLVRIYTRKSAQHGDLLFADQQFGQHTTTQRFDVWREDKRPATPEEISDMHAADQNDRERWRRNVDTSKEGT